MRYRGTKFKCHIYASSSVSINHVSKDKSCLWHSNSSTKHNKASLLDDVSLVAPFKINIASLGLGKDC